MANGDFLGYCYFKDENGKALFKVPILETSYVGEMYSTAGLSDSYLPLSMVSPYYSCGGEFTRASIDPLVGEAIVYSGNSFPRISFSPSEGGFHLEYLADDGVIAVMPSGTNYTGDTALIVMLYQPSSGQYATVAVVMDDGAGSAIWTRQYQPILREPASAAHWPTSVYDTEASAPGTPSTAETPTITQNLSGEYSFSQGGEASALTVGAEVSDGGIITYQWYKDDVAIDGATDASYMPSTAGVGSTTYYCIVTNTIGELTATVQSESVIVTINPAPPDPKTKLMAWLVGRRMAKQRAKGVTA